MSTSTLAVPLTRLAPRDWALSFGVHSTLLAAALWCGLTPTPEVQHLDLALHWVSPERAAPAPVLNTPQPPETQTTPAPQARPAPAPVARMPQQAPTPQTATPWSEPTVATASVPAPAPTVPQNAASEAEPSNTSARVTSEPASTQAAVSATTPTDDQAYQQWRARLEHRLQQGKRYPSSARRMGQSGTVVVELRIGADGSLKHFLVQRSSGFKALDNAAEELVRNVVQVLAAQATPGRLAELRIPIVYELTES